MDSKHRFNPFLIRGGRLGRVTPGLIGLAGLLFLLLIPGPGDLRAGDPAQPRRLAGTKGGDCAACHGRTRVLPQTHPATAALNLDQCRACHQDKNVSLRGRLPLAHLHHLSSLDCGDCHSGAGGPRAMTRDECLACHGTAKEVADRTRALDPNPHDSLHHGLNLGCDLCHRAHARSENFCNQCHDWKWPVP